MVREMDRKDGVVGISRESKTMQSWLRIATKKKVKKLLVEEITRPVFGLALVTMVLSACGGSSSDNGAAINLDNANSDEASLNDPGTGTSGNVNTDTENNAANQIPAAITPAVDVTDIGNPLFYRTGNNSARLTGPVFGTGERTDTDVVEKLDVFGPVGSPSISVQAVFSTRTISSFRDTSLTEPANLILVMHNSTDRLHCGSRLGEVLVVGKNGTIIKEDSSDRNREYITSPLGTHFDISDRGAFDSFYRCIAPGELVYSSIGLGKLTDVDIGKEFGLHAGITGGNPSIDERTALPVEPVLPVSYTINEIGDAIVVVENQSSREYQVRALAFALSQEGYPMAEFNARGSQKNIAPGETSTFELPTSAFVGSSSTLRVVLGLGDP